MFLIVTHFWHWIPGFKKFMKEFEVEMNLNIGGIKNLGNWVFEKFNFDFTSSSAFLVYYLVVLKWVAERRDPLDVYIIQIKKKFGFLSKKSTLWASVKNRRLKVIFGFFFSFFFFWLVNIKAFFGYKLKKKLQATKWFKKKFIEVKYYNHYQSNYSALLKDSRFCDNNCWHQKIWNWLIFF